MDLASLRAALKPLTKFGQDEFSFDMDEQTTVYLRPLLPKEEMDCQRRAQEILKEVTDTEGLADNDVITRTAALHYFDQFRSFVVSYALIQIGDVDFRGMTHIETGETTDAGVKVRIPLHKALENIITSDWSRAMITIAFAKYGDLIAKISEKAERVARDSIADLDAEIERVELRLRNLRIEREARAKGDPSVTSQQIAALVKAGAKMEEDIATTIETARADRAATAAIKRAPQEPDEEPEAEPEPTSSAVAQKPPRTPVTPPSAPPPTAPHPKASSNPQFRSSFEDLESPDSQAIEGDRIREAQGRAAAASRAVLGEPSDLSKASSSGTIDGKEVFRLPAETISPRGKAPPTQKTKVDPGPGAGTVNPAFKKSGG